LNINADMHLLTAASWLWNCFG